MTYRYKGHVIEQRYASCPPLLGDWIYYPEFDDPIFPQPAGLACTFEEAIEEVRERSEAVSA